MAGNENSGGLRPTASQNNPANVSALGGAGQSGQPKPGYTGFAYGQNSALEAQAAGAPLAAGPTPTPMAPITSLTAPSDRPNEPVTTGVAMGAGAGPEALALPTPTTPDNIAFNISIKSYAPALSYVASLENTSKETRQIIATLLREADV
tara:strand:+ start:722 stop:1171 length:450 start_codon:yes stop_codon:yes gene_type:complete